MDEIVDYGEKTHENKEYRRKWRFEKVWPRPWMEIVKPNFPDNYPFIGAEVGVWEGEHAWIIQHMMKPERLYLIDPWKDMAQYVGVASADDDAAFNFVKETFSPWPGTSQIRMRSIDAANQFPDNHFDFVYIDGAHDYANVLIDIKAWHPKIKHGAYLCGHDANFDGVISAIKDSKLCPNVKIAQGGTEWVSKVE